VPPAVRTYRGASAEERQATRRTRLLSACLDVVGEVGVLGVTVDAVCARAGLTKRYFYETFTDRDAALEAVTGDVYGSLHTSIVSALRRADGDGRARAAIAVEIFAATLDADPRIARLYAEAPGHPRLLARRGVRRPRAGRRAPAPPGRPGAGTHGRGPRGGRHDPRRDPLVGGRGAARAGRAHRGGPADRDRCIHMPGAHLISAWRAAFDTPFETAREARAVRVLLVAAPRVAAATLPGLERARGGAPDLMAVQSSAVASVFAYPTGEEVLPIGGFTGTGPSPTLDQLRADVAARRFRLVLPFRSTDPRLVWVDQHCRALPSKDPTFRVHEC
jgi:AcrR family transcriptional regulator